MAELPPFPEPLPLPVVDAHTHLTTTTERGMSVAQLIQAATDVNVTKLVDVGCDVESSLEAVAIAHEYDEVVACVALHPNDAARHVGGEGLGRDLLLIESLASSESSTRIRGIGETGLDYFRTTSDEGKALQKESFAFHIALAKHLKKTLVLHVRDAHADTVDLLNGEGWPEISMMHCFSGDVDHAKVCLDHGAYLSFPGTITFNANQYLRDALAITPLDRILVETDAPYLTPVPHRGKSNASYLMPHTVRFIAEQKGVPVETICEAVTANAHAVFGAW